MTQGRSTRKKAWFGVACALTFILGVAAIVISIDRRHLRLTEDDFLRGTVVSVHFDEPELASYTDRVIVRTDDGRTLRTGATRLPVVEGCRVTLQGGRTWLFGLKEFQIIRIDK
jgi:hypothetical protein